ncbi:hypothetical protein Cgig2_018346 [Carnegiea gigantea]|uniref:NPH3 domain-containing protein n=1 Tax=Carnegiea gigantea TaxID=171969 RepID=A0A9Q1L064_9CARY|nr:hypothetical protein Cgig2_018346 [Carnegiea gigantea]
MAPARASDSSSSLSIRTIPPNIRLSRGSSPPFRLDKELLAKRSSKVAALLDENPYTDLSCFFENMGVDPETLEMVARFCHGFDISMTCENVIPLICISHDLGMTDSHSPNNLLSKALSYFQHQILPSWDLTIRALRAGAHSFEHAVDIGLFDHCTESLLAHALLDPSLVAQTDADRPNNHITTATTTTTTYRSLSARRKLFCADHSTRPTEELTSLPLEIYEPVLEAMARRGVPPEATAGSLLLYLRRHVSNHNCKGEVIEAIERLLPKNHPLPPALLFELYTLALFSGAGPGCVHGLETRIGKQLDQATVKDLLALNLDVESLRRILKGYYGNFTDPDPSGLVVVADLMEDYLTEVASESDLDPPTFIKVAEMVRSTMSIGSDRSSDAVYRAVDVYLDKHKKLSELEREEVCQVLDFQRMSSDACDHAAQNQRLPLRVVVQALFVSQLQLRDNVIRAVGQSGNFSNVADGEEENKEEEVKSAREEEETSERREIGEGQKSNCLCERRRKKKVSLWKEMKRKFGCMGSSNGYEKMHDCNCQVRKKKKVHPNK